VSETNYFNVFNSAVSRPLNRVSFVITGMDLGFFLLLLACTTEAY